MGFGDHFAHPMILEGIRRIQRQLNPLGRIQDVTDEPVEDGTGGCGERWERLARRGFGVGKWEIQGCQGAAVGITSARALCGDVTIKITVPIYRHLVL
jgi:hypothetical protein